MDADYGVLFLALRAFCAVLFGYRTLNRCCTVPRKKKNDRRCMYVCVLSSTIGLPETSLDDPDSPRSPPVAMAVTGEDDETPQDKDELEDDSGDVGVVGVARTAPEGDSTA